jgi:glycolate oxidase FAD binding subunit
MDGALDVFAKEVGKDGPVTCVGGRTQWDVGGAVDADAREVYAPSGVVTFDPAEMTVRVRAGTRVADLDDALAGGGQMVPLDPAGPERATVGGVLAVGQSGVRRLRYGPVRDTLLEARFVSADGKVVKAGGPVVKNVTGFDLCRVLVGSLGTLGFLAEVVLRAQPRPAVQQWWKGHDDPFAVRMRLFRPSSILWDGTSTWVFLEGHPADVEGEAKALGRAFEPVAEPPPLDQFPLRQSVPPAAVRRLDGAFVAEVGVGTVHRPKPNPQPQSQPRVELDPKTIDLNQRLKVSFDPAGRLNPGRSVMPMVTGQ